MLLISAATTEKGLRFGGAIDGNRYLTGAMVSDEEIQAINVTPDIFHGEWG